MLCSEAMNKLKGRYINSNGYVEVWCPAHPKTTVRKTVREHRLVWEAYHKCCLLAHAIIHHKNGLKTDNRIENLVLMTQSQHCVQDHLISMSDRFCHVCKSKTTYIQKNGTPHWLKDNDNWLCVKCHDMKRYDRLRKTNTRWSRTIKRLS